MSGSPETRTMRRDAWGEGMGHAIRVRGSPQRSCLLSIANGLTPRIASRSCEASNDLSGRYAQSVFVILLRSCGATRCEPRFTEGAGTPTFRSARTVGHHRLLGEPATFST
jgi:hypothetical protein